jgi:hypothetical protein
VTEPEWVVAVRRDFSRLTDYPEGELESLVHIAKTAADAAYKRGVQAGRSQREYGPRTRRKKKETD